MRIRVACAAALCLAATPVFAQSPRDVTGPWTTNSPIVVCTDVPVTAKPVPRLVVQGAHRPDDQQGMTAGMVIIARSPDDGLAVGQRYVASRLRDETFGFPRPGEGYGSVRVHGWMTVRAIDDLNALAEIDFACDPIQPGDMLEPYAEFAVPTTATAADLAPDFSDRAKLIFGLDTRELVASGDIVSIDRGTAHGVVPGARFAVYRDKRNGLPLIHIGEVVVLQVGETNSKVMITKAQDGMQTGDVAVPRRQQP
jgi:hypothetical protein